MKGQVWYCRRRAVTLERPLVMGVLNVTPDSFYAQSRLASLDDVVRTAEDMIAQGAAILDVGGESTRPGAEAVAAEAEAMRVIPALRVLRERFPEMLLSVDTRQSAVAAEAIAAGVDIVNDVAGCSPDEGMLELVAKHRVGYVLMHGGAVPEGVPTVEAVEAQLSEALARALSCGVKAEQVVIDPGLGFAKTHAESLRLLSATARLGRLAPVLIGASRKRFLGALTGRTEAAERGAASVGAALWAANAGAAVVRVHDVAETVDAMTIWSAAKQEAENV